MTFTSPNVGDPAQSKISEPAALRTTAMGQNLAVLSDFIQDLDHVGHRKNGIPNGINVMFGDGHVIFVSKGANNKINQAFDPNLWADMALGNDAAKSGLAFRRFFYMLQP